MHRFTKQRLGDVSANVNPFSTTSLKIMENKLKLPKKDQTILLDSQGTSQIEPGNPKTDGLTPKFKRH